MALQAAIEQSRLQAKNRAAALKVSKSLWSRMTDDLDGSWSRISEPLIAAVTRAQYQSAASADAFVAAQIFETGQVDLPAADVLPAAFAGVTGSGYDLGPHLQTAVAKTKTAIGAGDGLDRALERGGAWLALNVLSAVSDAHRGALSTSIGMRPAITGYVRTLNPPSCSRCAILAGRWYRWNQGFRRHPRCDCFHQPSSEALSSDLRTDPYEYFHSLSKEEQAKAFGVSEARAIRDGGDIYRVVNVKTRGLASPYSKQAQKYGTPSRMTVDEIYRVAGTRTNAIRILEREGYITGPQTAGGNIRGQIEGFGALGRGGTRKGASRAVSEARATGVRDRLDRATMTAAERRLSDAASMMQTAEAGRSPWIKGRAITPAERELAQQILRKQVAGLATQPPQVRELARILGLI